MALPSSHSLRHAKLAAAFSNDFALDPNVFVAFYAHARKKMFLEALNFFLEAEEYRYLPQLLRVSKEKRIIEQYLQRNAKQQINIEGEVHRKVMAQQGSARAQLFDEAQLASAAIIAAEPWQEFRSSPQYKVAISGKKCKLKNVHKIFSEVVDDEVLPAALFFFFRQKQINLLDTEFKMLPTLRTWISDSQSRDTAQIMIDALSIDFDFLALKAYFGLIAHRPSTSIAFAHSLINENTVGQILEYCVDDPMAVQLATHRIIGIAARLYWLAFTRDWCLKHFAKVFSGAYVNENPDGELTSDRFESPMFLLASTIIETVLAKFDTLPIEFRGLLWACYVAGKSEPKFAGDEMLLTQKVVGKVLIEWLCDLISSPRHYFPDFICQGIAIRRQMVLAESLLRSIVEVVPQDRSPSMSSTNISRQLLYERMRSAYMMRLYNEINLHVVRFFSSTTLQLPVNSEREDPRFDVLTLASYLLNVGEDLRNQSEQRNRGLPGILFKFLARNNAIKLRNEEKELLSTSLISRFDQIRAPTDKGSSTAGRKRSHSYSNSPQNSSHSNPTRSITEDESSDSDDNPRLFGAELTEKTLLDHIRSTSGVEKERRETKFISVNRDRQDGTVIVLGGSVGGILVAKALARSKKFNIILIDEKEVFDMTQPLVDHIFDRDRVRLTKVHQEYRIPFQTVLANSGVLPLKGIVKEIAHDKVVLEDMTLMFDYLVIATEYQHRNPLSPPLAASMNLAHSRAELEDVTHCLVVGGGQNAVELAASLVSDFNPPKKVTLVLDDITLIPQLNADVDEHIRSWLIQRGVTIEFGEDVSIVNTPIEVTLEKGAKMQTNLVLSYSRRPIVAEKVFHCVNIPNTGFISGRFHPCLSDDGHILINQYMQMYSPSSKEVHSHMFALGDIVQFAGTQDAKMEYMAVLRQAAHIVEQISILTESRSKLDAINSGRRVLKPYKPIELEKRRVIRLGLKDAVATYYGAMFNTGGPALEIREQNFQFVKKEVLKEVKVEKKSALLAVAGTTVELKNPPHKIVILGATMSGRGAAKYLLEQGYRIRVALDNPAHRVQFVDYPGAEVVMIDWSDSNTLSRMLDGMDVFFHMVDNGAKLLIHSHQLMAPIKASKLKYVVKSVSGTDQLWSPKYQKFPIMRDALAAEEELKSIGIPTIIVRPAPPYECFSFWWGEDIRKFGSFITAGKSFGYWISLQDLAECIANILLYPKKYYEVGEPIPLNADGIFFDQIGAAISEGIGKKLHFLLLADRKVYKEYLIHDGFSETFIDNFILPMHFDYNMTPDDTKSFDWAAKIIKRQPKSMTDWAKENCHLFVD